MAAGESPPSRPGTPGTIADIVFGVIWYRLLATRQPAHDRLIDELVATLAGRQTETTVPNSQQRSHR